MSEIVRGTYGEWGTAIRATSRSLGYLAWGCLGETGGNGPFQEKNEVWFQFGASEEDALRKLHEELDRLIQFEKEKAK